MGNWINKHLFKNKCVQAVIHHTDRRMTQHFVIPKTGMITIKDQSYAIDNDTFYMNHGYRTYVYAENNINSINLFRDPSIIPPDELNTAISARVATEIFLANKANIDKMTIVMILSGLAVAGVLGLGYLLMKRFDELETTIDTLEQILRAMGGYIG